MKTSLRRLSSSSSEDVLIKTKIFALHKHLQNTSSRRLDQYQYIRIGHTSSRRFQIFSTTSCKNVFKRSSRYLQDVLQRCLQNVFKTYHQVKLFLLTHFILLISFYTHWKHQKTRGFLCFQGVSKKIGGMKWVRKSSRRIQHVSKAYCKDCYQQKD